MADNIADYYDSALDEYDISVCIIAYNKIDFIRDAVESVLMQKTEYTYEIVVGDNLSTDGTRDVLKEYWNNNKNVFSLIFNKQNLLIARNTFNTICRAKGKYIVFLNADDYFIDEKKLQMQVDFYKNHEEYAGIATTSVVRYSGEQKNLKTLPACFLRDRIITLSDFLAGYDFGMRGFMFKSQLLHENIEHFHKMVESSPYIDDLSFCILLLMLGNVYTLDRPTAVYRVFRKEGNSFTSTTAKYKICSMEIELLNNLDKNTDYSLDLHTRYGLFMVVALYNFLRHRMTWKEYRSIKSKVSERYQKHLRKYIYIGILRSVKLRLGERK